MGADLSRLGGGIGTRGPGETKLEVDRRRIQRARERAQPATRRRTAAARRSASSHRRDPLVALVGYTNVGKSSLLNALARSDALVADRPFATLDPTVRRAYLATAAYARIADTVGFITDLPKDLVNAFRATLEELREADLLVHVLDASNPDWPRQRARGRSDCSTNSSSIARLACSSSTSATSLTDEPAQTRRQFCVSAATGAGLDALREALVARTALPA